MARGRMISKSISTSRKFAALAQEAGKLGEFAQILYLLLTPHADDFGRLDGDPFTMKHLLFPTSPRPEQDFELALKSMDKVGLINWYVVEGQRYIEITRFDFLGDEIQCGENGHVTPRVKKSGAPDKSDSLPVLLQRFLREGRPIGLATGYFGAPEHADRGEPTDKE